ncbi:MAG: hypothetical protein AUI16_29805 [Alphaproteobacteria bacterium 13_2_20CM_2_64_7]|nr:MAG: hypothetical protein AUI16_29805 [Alphaproteobacteria bacterium 13_2_20CM_2_64_7]
MFDAQDGSHLWTIPILPLDFGRFRGIVGFFVDASLCLLSESGDALKLSLSDGIAQRAAGVSDMSLLGWSFPVAFDGRVLTTSGVGSRESIRAIDWVRRSVNDLGIGVDSIELAAPSGIDHVLFGSENGAVSELDVVRGLFSGSFSPHGGRVAGMASIISSDRVVSVSRDGIVHISERSTGQLLVRIYLGFA